VLVLVLVLGVPLLLLLPQPLLSSSLLLLLLLLPLHFLSMLLHHTRPIEGRPPDMGSDMLFADAFCRCFLAGLMSTSSLLANGEASTRY
jgi:hypothetical protein